MYAGRAKEQSKKAGAPPSAPRREAAAPRLRTPRPSGSRRPDPSAEASWPPAVAVPRRPSRGRGPAVPRAGGAAARRAGQRGGAEPLPRDNFDQPDAGVVLVAGDGRVDRLRGLGLRRCRAGAGRRLLVADLAVARRLMLAATPLVKGDVVQRDPARLLDRGRAAGLGDPLALAGRPGRRRCSRVVDLRSAPELTQANYGNVFLIDDRRPARRATCATRCSMAAERDRAPSGRRGGGRAGPAGPGRPRRRAPGAVAGAATRRRARRGGRRAGPAGGGAGGRAALADPPAGQRGRAGRPGRPRDLGAALERLATPTGDRVARPASPVDLPARPWPPRSWPWSRACLDNVAAHVGPRRRPGCCSRSLGDRVVVVVRDEGPGIPGGRLDEAAAEGRLGVLESIRGRIADLGGTRGWTPASFGTEWELVVPPATAGASARDDPPGHPFADPEPGPGTPASGAGGRRGDVVDDRRGREAGRADRDRR